MSTHNIGFYEDLTKIIFELSSDIVKYAPYFFCCLFQNAFFYWPRLNSADHLFRNAKYKKDKHVH